MIILHVNKFFDLRDGTDMYVDNLMQRQQAMGHEVHVFSTRSPNNAPSKDQAFFVERFDYARREGLFRDIRKALSFVWNREAKSSFERLLDTVQPDVVHLHNIYHHLSSSILVPLRRRGIPCVQTLHDYKLACPNYKMLTENAVCERCKGGHYFEAVRHQCLGQGAAVNVLAAFEMGMTKITQAYERTVAAFICPSVFMADTMKAWGEPPSKLRVLPNAVAFPETLGTHDQPFYLAAGRLSAEKGLETIIRAVAALPHIHLKIAGIGSEEGRLRALALQLEAKNIEWLGFLRKTELYEVRCRARALLVPSVWYENAPGSVLEAMADGLPVIASRIGGLPEMVEHGQTGFLAAAGDVADWQKVLQDMWDLPQAERMRMGEEARQRAQDRYSWERHMEGLFRIYREVGAPVDETSKKT